jgi:hypothetical protein
MTFLDKIFSSILGIVTSIIIYKYYNKKEIYFGPDSNLIKKKMYKHNNICFYFSPFAVTCGINDLS